MELRRFVSEWVKVAARGGFRYSREPARLYLWNRLRIPVSPRVLSVILASLADRGVEAREVLSP